MKEETFRGRRRVGAALLAGVTALGAAGVAVLASGGVAAAATPTVTTTAATTTIAGTSTNGTTQYPQAGGSVTLNVNGSVGQNDQMQIVLGCQSGAIEFSSANVPTLTVNGAANANWAASLTTNGACGSSVDNVIKITYSGAASVASPSVVVSGIDYVTTAAASGAVSLSGTYVPAAAAPVNFSVASDATVSAIATTSNLPATTLASGTTNQAISNVTFNEPAGFPANFALTGTAGALKLTINSNVPGTATGTTAPNATFGSGAVSWTQSNGGSTSNGTATVVAGTSSSYGSISLTPTAASTGTNATITISGLELNYLGSGPVTAEVTYIAANPNNGGAATIDLGKITLASAIGSSNRIQGSDGTADGTVAEEFLSAFPNGNTNVVLATDVDPYDALSAAYLEKALGTGLLITSPTSLNANAITAMRIAGVKNVYVVGGVDAVSQNVISQIEALPAYNEGGFTTTSSNVTVVQRLSGATADATAQQIATFAGSVPGSINIAGAYSAASGTNGGGVYNDTSGTASATGPAGAVPTAFVIANTDWQDATTLSPIAYYDRIPILLTPAGSLGQEASSALTSLGIKQVVVVGGNLALSNNVVSSIQALNGGISVLRIAGYDYTETATQLAKFELATGSAGLSWSPSGILVARGNYWSDALGGAAMAATGVIGSNNYGAMPIVTTENQTTIGTYLQSFLTSEAGSSISTVNVLGGPLAVTPSVVTQIQTTLAG